jgi:hypothetical protein
MKFESFAEKEEGFEVFVELFDELILVELLFSGK